MPRARDSTSHRVLDVRNLNVWFDTATGEVQAVRDVSFAVGAAETVGLVGESGSGKSVTAMAIMGLLNPDISRVTGQVFLDGWDLIEMRQAELAELRGREICMIFQDPMTALDPLFRIGDQVVETIRAHHRVSRKAAKARAIEVLGDVGIPDAGLRSRAYPHQLSGGMRQRVMIAMSLVLEPKLIIADEPTTALDVTIQGQILELLQQLTRDHGTALLLITHDLGVIAETCSSLRTMYAGEIVEVCTVDEALESPLHPYTSGLTRAIPSAHDRKTQLYTIPGRVPALADMPAGCRFQYRCEHLANGCEKPQSLLSAGEDRTVRCWQYSSLKLPGTIPGGN